jgi:hypothetical protein
MTILDEKGHPMKMLDDPWKFLADTGLLFELNRLVLHPLGLALVMSVDDAGNHTLAGIWDNRDDPEGIAFAADAYANGEEKSAAYRRTHFVPRLPWRFKALGYIVQGQPGSISERARKIIGALLEATKGDDRAQGLSIEMLSTLDPGSDLGLAAHWSDEAVRLVLDINDLHEEGWRVFGYMPNRPEQGVLPLGPLIDWIHDDPPTPPELPLPKLLGTLYGFGEPGGRFLATLPAVEPAQAVLARRIAAHPRAIIVSASEAYADESIGTKGGVVARMQVLVPRDVHDELDRDWGDAGGPDDRLIAETARRATGLSSPFEVAQRLAERLVPERNLTVLAPRLYLGALLRWEFPRDKVLLRGPVGEPIDTRTAILEIEAGSRLGLEIAEAIFPLSEVTMLDPPAPRCSPCPDGSASIGTDPPDSRTALYAGRAFIQVSGWGVFRVRAGVTPRVLHTIGPSGHEGLTTVDELERSLVRGLIQPVPEERSANAEVVAMREDVATLTSNLSAAVYADTWLRASLWRGQREMLRGLDLHGIVAVAKGNKTGGTWAAAAAALWWAWNVRGGTVLVSMESYRFLDRIFLPSLGQLALHAGAPVPAQHWHKHGEETALARGRGLVVEHALPDAGPKSREPIQLVPFRHLAEACAGLDQRARTLIIVDGGPLPPDVGAVLDETVAMGGALLLAMDTPRPEGWFADLFRSSRDDAALRITLSAEEVPNVVLKQDDVIVGLATSAWVEEMRREFGPDYASHPIYRARVLGKFPLAPSPAQP